MLVEMNLRLEIPEEFAFIVCSVQVWFVWLRSNPNSTAAPCQAHVSRLSTFNGSRRFPVLHCVPNGASGAAG